MSRSRFTALALLGAAAGCPATQLKPESDVARTADAVVVVSAELRGYLGPCGCSANMRGGIARTAEQLRSFRTEGAPVAFVDSGDALFGAESIPTEAVAQQERKATAMAQALRAMHLDTRTVGPLDDARGADFRRALQLPELDSLRVLQLGKLKLGVVTGQTAPELAQRSAQARREGARWVLGLFVGPSDRATELAAASGVDLLVPSRAKDEVAGETSRLFRGEVPVAQVQSKGRSLLRIDVWDGAGDKALLLSGAADRTRELSALDERIELLRAQTNDPSLSTQMRALRQAKLEELEKRRAVTASAPPQLPNGQRAFSVRFVPLESSLPEEPTVKGIVSGYDRDVNALNLEYARTRGKDCPTPTKEAPGFVGNAPCRECHEETFAVWEASKHAQGLQTLVKAEKQFHLDCIGCHVTGWQRSGGVCRIDKTQGREGVGCESCHGPGSTHSDDPTARNVLKGDDPKVCVSCHDRENSPHFDFDKYVAQILGKGHGAKAP